MLQAQAPQESVSCLTLGPPAGCQSPGWGPSPVRPMALAVARVRMQEGHPVSECMTPSLPAGGEPGGGGKRPACSHTEASQNRCS